MNIASVPKLQTSVVESKKYIDVLDDFCKCWGDTLRKVWQRLRRQPDIAFLVLHQNEDHLMVIFYNCLRVLHIIVCVCNRT